MCGLFGMIGVPHNKALMQSMLQEAGKRGPNAWGVVLKNEQGLSRYTRAESLLHHADNVFSLFSSTIPQAFIGQSRLATSGTYKSLNNNQPLIIGEDLQKIAIAHNGNVYNYAQLIRNYDLHPQTQCDSEVLGLLIAQNVGSLFERTLEAIYLIDNRSPMALIVINNTEMVVVKRGQPLYQTRQDGCILFCSRAINDQSDELHNHMAWSWSLESCKYTAMCGVN